MLKKLTLNEGGFDSPQEYDEQAAAAQ